MIGGVVIIRDEQLSAFADLSLERYLAGHVTRFAPDHAQTMSTAGLREFVRLGIERAGDFGWKKRGPVEFLLEAMVVLGSEFPTDPQYPWAAQTLGKGGEEMAIADELHAGLMKYYDSVLGPGLCYEAEAIRRLLANEAGMLQWTGINESTTLARLQWVYPQKCAFVGSPALEALIGEAKARAAEVGLLPGDLGLVTGALFCFGHGCFHDPQYPWIAPALAIDGVPKAAGLTRVLKKYLEGALAAIERG